MLVIVCIMLCLMVPFRDSAVAEKRGFTFADVRRRAEALARQPFVDKRGELPPSLHLTYDQYRDIRFRPDKALWRHESLPFEVQLFHRAAFKTSSLDKVAVNTVEQGRVVPVHYSRDLFDFGHNVLPELPSGLGFAGFRLHYPLHREDYYDEIALFLGASYFRALGQHQHYGLSARGLAIDTALDKKEEFPRFLEFWVQKPDREASDITVYALMDSQSVTGAYRFTIRPGKDTILIVKTHVFMRRDVEKIGFAPLTSMFSIGEGTNRDIDDFRPEVHDSDGLLLATGHGEWLWRPLDNPAHLRVSSFRDTNPRGFGLLQRDRNFDHYQDLESFFEKRPSTWIEPLGDWGKGVLQLVELPSDADWYDNIVAFWIPDERAKEGKEWQFEYRMHFSLDKPGLPPGGQTYATRIGKVGADDGLQPDKRQFVIDFAGKRLKDLDANTPVEAVVTVSSGQIDHQIVQRNPFIDGWRVFFELQPEGETPVELRCFLKGGGEVLTETWSYQWTRK